MLKGRNAAPELDYEAHMVSIRQVCVQYWREEPGRQTEIDNTNLGLVYQ